MGTFIISEFTSTDTTAPLVRHEYAADSFNRAGPALGATEIGAFPWSQKTDSVHKIEGGQLVATTIPADGQSIAWFEEPNINGILTATLVSMPDGTSAGILVGYNPATQTSYSLVREGKFYLIKRRTSAGVMTTLVTSANNVAADGDVIELEVNGAELTAFVNGVQVLTVTNSLYVHGPAKGVWAFVSGGSTTHRIVWDNVSWSEL